MSERLHGAALATKATHQSGSLIAALLFKSCIYFTEFNRMNTKQLLSMLMALPFVQGTFASEYIACNGCSLSQMTNVARAHGVGRYVVGDITGNKVEALRVQSGIHGAIPERMAPHGINQVVFDNLTPAEVQAFSYYRDFYHAAPAGYKKHYNLIIVRSGAAASTSYNDHVDAIDRKSTRLNSSHHSISYAVF